LRERKIDAKIDGVPDRHSIYRRTSSMEPLIPESGRAALARLSAEIFEKAGELKATFPSPQVRSQVAGLVRQMNSYYSNLIEGHKTLPRDIERALQADFSSQEDDRRNQLLSVAHIRAEDAMRARLNQEPELSAYEPDFIRWIHGEFYSHLPGSEWRTTSHDGTQHPLTPGEWRDHNVDVGRHTPPDHPALPGFMDRFFAFYTSTVIPATDQLIALAAAHHRLVWIHPFGDGNGRVARLQSQAVLIRLGLDGEGMWTLSRGLARTKREYFEQLQAADQDRRNDYDGRGNLSDRALAEFCHYFLSQLLDQLEFMVELIAPVRLVKRIENYLRFVRADLDPRRREHLARLLKALCLEGEVTRGEVAPITGLQSTASRDVIREALRDGLITSPSPKGPLRIAFPNKVAEYYFPNLFSDLPADPA